jgi:hypothetical protein
MAIRHGKDTKITLNAATVCVTNWSVNTSVEEITSTTTCSGGFAETITGLKNAEWSFDVMYDDTYQESSGVLAAIEEGDTISLEFFAFNTDTDPWFDMPTARVNAVSATGDVNSVVTVSYSGTSNGEYEVKAIVAT